MADVDGGGNQNFDLGFMKINYYLMLGIMMTAGAVAQQTNNPVPPVNPLPPLPLPVESAAPAAPAATAAETVAPKKKTGSKHHKKSTKKLAAKAEVAAKSPPAEPPSNLVPGPAKVVASNLNIRGQAGMKGEVVAHLQKGDVVTVLSQINLDKHKADEPAQWAKIALPQGSSVWVRSSFINEKDKTVLPNKLNLRAGPSEDYSVLGVLDRGAVVNEVGAKGEWSKIDAPTNAFGFVAARYLEQEPAGSAPANPPSSPEAGLTAANTMPSTTTTVPEAPAIPDQTQPPVPSQPTPPAASSTLLPPPITSENASSAQPGAIPAPTTDENLTPPPPRVVTHEGYVRDSVSIVAPTYFELYDPSTQVAIDYLHSTTTNLDLSRYNGFQIIVTGQEGLDARWKDTPVLDVQRIYVVSTNKPVVPILKSPRARSIH
jgi:uncharacterized protein YgiM (DUF1202 family)